MDVQERRVKEKRNSRRDYYTVVGILAYIGSLIFRIPLFYLIGEKGVGYFGIVYELYLVIGFVFAYGLSEATSALIRFRIKREQFKNAQKVLHGALLLSGILGVMLCVVLLISGNFLAEKLMGSSFLLADRCFERVFSRKRFKGSYNAFKNNRAGFLICRRTYRSIYRIWLRTKGVSPVVE